MSESTSTIPRPARPSLVPPDPYEGRRQSGPARLMLLGLAVSIAAYVARGRLASSTRAADVTPTASPSTRPTLADGRPVASKPAMPATVDAFGSIGGPDESVVAPPTKRDEPSLLRLQSIVVGPRRRVCMINDRAYVVGDTIDGATIESIGRASVVVRRAGHESVIALPAAHP